MQEQKKNKFSWIYNRGEITIVVKEWDPNPKGKRKTAGYAVMDTRHYQINQESIKQGLLATLIESLEGAGFGDTATKLLSTVETFVDALEQVSKQLASLDGKGKRTLQVNVNTEPRQESEAPPERVDAEDARRKALDELNNAWGKK